MMNKCFNSIVFLSSLLFFSQACANDPFIKLRPSNTKNAIKWTASLDNALSTEDQLAFLNLFAINPEDSIAALIKCAEYIESHPEMTPFHEQLSTNIIESLKKYTENFQEKIARKQDLTEEQEESLWQKLEIKIQELIAYINSIYYHALYNHIKDKNPSSLLYMFDENGVIPAENRTKNLPQPQ